jgi:hypothetical protein
LILLLIVLLLIYYTHYFIISQYIADAKKTLRIQHFLGEIMWVPARRMFELF